MLVEQIIRYLNFAGKTFLGIITTIILFFFFRIPEGYRIGMDSDRWLASHN